MVGGPSGCVYKRSWVVKMLQWPTAQLNYEIPGWTMKSLVGEFEILYKWLISPNLNWNQLKKSTTLPETNSKST